MSENSFHRSEKLKSKKCIGILFESGRSAAVYPIKALWLERKTEKPSPVRAGFTVSKRTFKLAVDRNLLKRRMREAYRLNKTLLLSRSKRKILNLDIMFIYLPPKKEKYRAIEKAMIEILTIISRQQED